MNSVHQLEWMSEADYLESEKHSEIKHEYVDGHVYAMLGAHRHRNTISINMLGAFLAHL